MIHSGQGRGRSRRSDRAAVDTSALMQRGREALREGKKAEARFLFRAVLEREPSHADALLGLAYLAGGGRPSMVYLARLLEADPANRRAHAAVRWARTHASTRDTQGISPAPAGRTKQDDYVSKSFVVFTFLLAAVVGALLSVAFAQDPSKPATTRTQAAVSAEAFTHQPLVNSTQTGVLIPTISPIASRAIAPVSSDVQAQRLRAGVAQDVNRAPSDRRRQPAVQSTKTATVKPSSSAPAAATDRTDSTLTPLSATAAAPTSFPTARVGDAFRWIDVDLTHQRLVAYEGETPVRSVTVSTGLPRTPTVKGRFKIWVKFRTDDMSGPDYYLRDVPYVMYFYRGYGLHGTYWHDNFGQPMSHGCVNLPTSEAEWLFNWASVGTPVVVHD